MCSAALCWQLMLRLQAVCQTALWSSRVQERAAAVLVLRACAAGSSMHSAANLQHSTAGPVASLRPVCSGPGASTGTTRGLQHGSAAAAAGWPAAACGHGATATCASARASAGSRSAGAAAEPRAAHGGHQADAARAGGARQAARCAHPASPSAELSTASVAGSHTIPSCWSPFSSLAVGSRMHTQVERGHSSCLAQLVRCASIGWPACTALAATAGARACGR